MALFNATTSKLVLGRAKERRLVNMNLRFSRQFREALGRLGYDLHMKRINV